MNQDPKTGRILPKTTSRTREAIIRGYTAGATMAALAVKFGLALGSVYYILHRGGAVIRPYHKLTKAQRNGVVADYASGMTCGEIASKLGVDETSVWMLLRTRKVEMRDRYECGRTYQFDETVFDTITEESAYFVGLLMADGCVVSRGTSFMVSLGLAETDKDHVERFRLFMKSNHVIYFSPSRKKNRQNQYRLTICSPKLGIALGKFGIVPRKSLTAKVIGGLEQDRNFWRGCVDGDGEVSIYKQGSSERPRLGLVGSQAMLRQFADFIKQTTGYDAKVNPMGNIFSVIINCSHAERLAHVLYDGCTVALPRKLAKARAIFAREDRIRDKRRKVR